VKPVLVTGASGAVGREVVVALSRRGVPVRAATEQPHDVPDGVEPVDPETLDALEGAGAVFLVHTPGRSGASTHAFLGAAARAGVEHIVFQSVAGAGRDPLLGHHVVEEQLRRTSLAWTILRPTILAQTLGEEHRRDIVEDDALVVPAGRAHVPFVDARDVADVAAHILLAPARHVGGTHALTGAVALSFGDIAALLSSALGRPIHYRPATVPGYMGHLAMRGLPVAHIVEQAILHVGLRFGQGTHVDPTLVSLLGREPRSLEGYVHEHLSSWRRDPTLDESSRIPLA
jgi:uncharacterized protein YbjT (DUF2867 family)